MRIREFVHHALFSALAIAAALVAAAPAAAQKDISPANVRHVRGTMDSPAPGTDGAFTFVKVTATQWKGLEKGTTDFVQQAQDANTISLVAGGTRRVVLDIANKTFVESATGARGRISYMSADTCLWWTARTPGTTCTCDLRSLRPLQGAVGMGEVTKKRKDIQEDLKKELADLNSDPIKIIRSISNELFVVDHHHGARAWLDAGYSAGVCQYVANIPGNVDFWQELNKQSWVRLVDQRGDPLRPEDLPKTLGQEPDDPYRTLAWMVRKADGYCRKRMVPPPPPFAEFLWADWMRKRPELPLAQVASATASSLWEPMPGESKKQINARRTAAQAGVLNAALTLARGLETAKLPGYQGTAGLTGEKCNPKGD